MWTKWKPISAINILIVTIIMETAEVPCMLQCGEPCNPPRIGFIERWESIRQKALLWKGLEVFMNALGVGHVRMIPACRLMFSNTKKLGQAQKRP